MTDFFERQEQARRQTRRLYGLFALAVLLAVLLFYGAAASMLWLIMGEGRGLAGWWHPKLFGAVAMVTCFTIGMGAHWKWMELAEQGGRGVAFLLGAEAIDCAHGSADERQVVNVVEEMAIASGLPVPAVYIVKGEYGINAFAAGHTPRDAILALTEGAVRYLDRDELQAVVGHELSHILNGDIRVNMLALGLLNGFLWISLAGEALQSDDASIPVWRSGGGDLPLVTGRRRATPASLLLKAVGAAGFWVSRSIKSAVSRRRETLADAASVQFTRNPAALASTLKKIGGLAGGAVDEGSRLNAFNAEEGSHLYFATGVEPSRFPWLATHPPLLQRIRALDSAFGGEFPPVFLRREWKVAPLPVEPAPSLESGRTQAKMPAAHGISPMDLLASVGCPGREHLCEARDLLNKLPEPLRAAAHQADGAAALLGTLLLSTDPAVRAQQLQAVTTPIRREKIAMLSAEVAALGRENRLVLLELAAAAVRSTEIAEAVLIEKELAAMADTDHRLDLFEFIVLKWTANHLPRAGAPQHGGRVPLWFLEETLEDGALLLSGLAEAGHETEEEAAAAFGRGASLWKSGGPDSEFVFRPQRQDRWRAMAKALDRLAGASPAIKRRLLGALATVAAHDGAIRPCEAELLRLIGHVLGCPIPPAAAQTATAEVAGSRVGN